MTMRMLARRLTKLERSAGFDRVSVEERERRERIRMAISWLTREQRDEFRALLQLAQQTRGALDPAFDQRLRVYWAWLSQTIDDPELEALPPDPPRPWDEYHAEMGAVFKAKYEQQKRRREVRSATEKGDCSDA